MTKLSAVSLKEALWDTLNQVKENGMQPSQGDAVASQAREILRNVPTEIIDFAEKS